MDETTFMWVLGTRTMHGISLEKLKQLGKDDPNQKIIDWNSLIPFPSDFVIDSLPDNNLNPFLYDSNLFLALGEPLDEDILSSKIYQLSFNHHHDGGDDDSHNNKLLPWISEAPPEYSIPPLPNHILYHSPYVVHVAGKVYLLGVAFDKWGGAQPSHDNFWVLEPGIREWRPLESPPPVANLDFGGPTPEFFALHDKIFFEAFSTVELKHHLYCFDIQAENWYKMDAKLELEPLIMAGSLPLPIMAVSLPIPIPVPDRMVVIASRPVPLDVDPLHQLSVKF